jgi:hypothetical protein
MTFGTTIEAKLSQRLIELEDMSRAIKNHAKIASSATLRSASGCAHT